MTGWLIVNSFIEIKKFNEIYSYLLSAAQKYGLDIELKKTCDVFFLVGEKIDLPDFVLFWDKDVNLAALLENMGVRVFNSAKAIEICDSKSLTAICLSKAKIKMPKTYLAPKTFEAFGYNNTEFLKKAGEALGFPMVIKESYGSFGQQVYLANNFSEAEKIVSEMGAKEFIMQEFIAESKGRDIRVNVVGGKVVAAMLRYSENGDFRSNISNGGKMKAVDITNEQAQLAIDACRAIGLDFAGVDVLFGKNGESIICEVNSNPHFKSTFDCTGVDLSEEIIKYIKGRL